MTPNAAETKAQIVYFSHGGGPLPILGDASHKAMVEFMARLPGQLRRPDAILVISAHWEEKAVTLLGAQQPVMFFDYYVVGSGFSFHNLRAFSWEGTAAPDPANDDFQDWLIETCSGRLTEEEREQRLLEWTRAPSARYCHPRAEHLLPLHVCQALAQSPARLVFDDQILGKRGVAFLWR